MDDSIITSGNKDYYLPQTTVQPQKETPRLQESSSKSVIFQAAERAFSALKRTFSSVGETKPIERPIRKSISQSSFGNVKRCAAANLQKISQGPAKQEIVAPKVKDAQTLVALTAEGGIEKLQTKKAETAHVPPGTANNLLTWLKDNSATLATKTTRVPYTEEDIHQALGAFEKECACSWQQMKHKWGDKLEWMQIINDVRAMQIDQISAKLKQEFPGLQIFDFGSDKLTSDRDLSLSISTNKDKEVLAVERYNQLFAEANWGASAAHIFDNNAYTQFYIESLNTVDHQKEQLEQQNMMSYVMFVRNAGNERWESLKSEILKKADPSNTETLKKQFVRVESLVHQLEGVHNQEMVRTGLQISSEKSLPTENLSDLAKQIESDHTRRDLIITVDNSLHDKYKKEVGETISQRTELNMHMLTMGKKDATPEMRIQAYKQSIEIINTFIDRQVTQPQVDQQIDRLQKQYNVLQKEAAWIEAADPKKAKDLREQAFILKEQIDDRQAAKTKPGQPVIVAEKQTGRLQKQYETLQKEAARIGAEDPKKAKALREQSSIIQKQMKELQAAKVKIQTNVPIEEAAFVATIKKWSACRAEISQAEKQLRELESLPLTINLLKQKTLEASLSGGNTEKYNKVSMQLKEAIHKWENRDQLRTQWKQQIADANKELDSCNQNDIGKLEKLTEMSDKMQLSAEANSMKAQCFAQEAHVTAGAFGFVVQDIQGGHAIARDLGAYMQATNELMGFYHAHQGHAHTPHGKMIEVSKYVGPRLMEGYKRMQEQAASKGIDFPILEKAENIRFFFNELLSIRGGSIHPETVRMGLEQVEDGDIQKWKGELARCKSKTEAMKILEEHGIADKMKLIDKYFTMTDKGGVPDAQQKALVEDITKRHGLPLDKNGEIDTRAVDNIMNGMHAQTIAWMAQLTPEQALMLPQT